MSSVCSNFRPNFWRPTTCSNCLRPKSRHGKLETQCSTPPQLANSKPVRSKSASEAPKKLVGVVSPYAVVEVRGGSLADGAGTRSRSFDLPPATDNAAGLGSKTTTSRFTPKRKAPPPPNQQSVRETKPSKQPVTTNDVSTVKKEQKMAPKKPPRTSSTYLEDTADVGVEYSALNDCRSVPRGWVGGHLACLMADTVQRVYAKFLERVMRPDSLWAIDWHHLSLLSSNEVAYKGVQMTIQKLPKKLEGCIENDIRCSQHLTPHPNLCLVRAILPPPSLPALSASSHYLLRDSCGVGTLAELLPTQRESCTPLQLRQLLLMCMVQVLSAVQFIHTRCVCHRDIGLDTLYVVQYGDHWILKLGRFGYAVQRSGPLTTKSFMYSYCELKWLGGANSRLPPEILNTEEGDQTLDYSGTDIFAVGCLFYEFLGLDNPFEECQQLVHRPYKVTDLPSLPPCRIPTQKLAHLLLSRGKNNRPSPSSALLLCQALLWLPIHWFECAVTAEQLLQQLEYDQGCLIASLATMDIRPVPLPHALKADFLQKCHVPTLLRCLPLLHTL